jgi:hypothetical protein
MNNDLDPVLSQWFADAEQSLPPTTFLIELERRQQRQRRIRAPLRVVLITLRGLAAAARAPFRLRPLVAVPMALLAGGVTLALLI